MSARKVSQHQTALSIRAVNFDGSNRNYLSVLGILDAFEFEMDSKLEEGGGVNLYYDFMQVVKQGGRIRATLKQDGGVGGRAAGIDVTAYQSDGDLLADLKSGTITLKNETRDGSGISDLEEYPNITGSNIKLQANHLIPVGASAISLLSKVCANEASLPDRNITLGVTVAGVSWSWPGIIGAAKHSIKKGELQSYDATFDCRGTPTLPADPGNPTTSLYHCAALGTGKVGLYAASGAGNYGVSGSPVPCIIDECTIELNDGAIVMNSFTFLVQGQTVLT